MPARYFLLCVAVVALLATRGIAGPAAPTTQVAGTELSTVWLDLDASPAKPPADGVPPLLVVGGLTPAAGHFRAEYGYATSGNSVPGSRYLLRCLGGAYPDRPTIAAETFERRGEQIRLTFRFDGATAGPPTRQGAYCFFVAALDDVLPDGIYQVTVELKNLPGNLRVPAVQKLEFRKPDPRIAQATNERQQAKTLTPKELFDRYCAVAAEIKGIDAPHEENWRSYIPRNYVNPNATRLAMLKAEIIRRGPIMGPLLIESLKEHAVRNAEPPAFDSAPPPEPPTRPKRIDAENLIRDNEEERRPVKRMAGKIGPEIARAVLHPNDGEVVGSLRLLQV